MPIYEMTSTILRSYVRTERGASLVEYALLVALIAMVCIVGVTMVGTETSTRFSSTGSTVN